MQQKTIKKNINSRSWQAVPAADNKQIRIRDKLKSIPWRLYLKGNMLTEDSWCGLGNDYQTKPVGKNQILTFFSVRLLSSLTICSLQFQFISTVLTKALNRNKPSVRGLVNTITNTSINYQRVPWRITHRDIPLQLLMEVLVWPVVQHYSQHESEFSLK